MKASVTLLALLFFVHPALAQVNEFKDRRLTARAYVDVPYYGIDIQNKVNLRTVKWRPNIRTLTGADLAINGFITVGMGWANNVGPEPAAQKGDSSYNDYRVGMTLRKLRLEADYGAYTGFYVDNTVEVDPATASAGMYLQDSSMTAKNISVNGTWIMNSDRYSYAAVFGQSERQETSAGSVVLGLCATDTFFSSGNYLIPATVRANFGEDQNIKQAQFYGLTAKVGYGYTFIADQHLFFGFLFDVGYGFEYRKYGDGVTETSSGGGAYKLDGLISVGYNGDAVLAALIFTGDETVYTTQSLNIPSGLGDVKLVVGAHF